MYKLEGAPPYYSISISIYFSGRLIAHGKKCRIEND